MKKQLKIEYKDGSKVKLTNNKTVNNDVFISYLKGIAISQVKSAILYTYPLVNNEPLILVEDGVPINANVYSLTHK